MNYKILMVDDDRELLKMLNQYFTLKNYTVIIAENGIEAMEKISANPDIILLDVNMPGMDGIEVMIMAIYTGHKMISGKSRKKKEVSVESVED